MSPGEKVVEFSNRLNDMKLAEKQALVELHILPSDYDKEDFFELNEILATTEEQKQMDPMELFKQVNRQ